MAKSSERKPVSNFFVKKQLQTGLILRIAAVTLVSTLIAANTIVLVYYLQHRSVLLYQLHASGNLTKQNIFELILPSLVISVIVNLILAAIIGLYASRKFAVPIYKLEQWARLMRAGKLNATLRFREQQEMQETMEQFNSLAGDMRTRFAEVKTLLEKLKSGGRDDNQIRRVDELVAGLDLTSAPEVDGTAHTPRT